MSPWIKLSLPIGLGLIAGVLNWASTSSKLSPLKCVGIATPLERGRPFEENHMMPIEIRGDLSQLREVAIPWEERAILYGRQAPRNFTTGDLLLWGDATPLPKEIVAQPDEVLIHVSLASMTMVPDFLRVDQQIGFMIRREAKTADVDNGFVNLANKESKAELLGPFTVKAIGTRLVDADHPESESGDPRILTIPVKYLKSLKQLEDKADRLQASLTGYSEERVVGVVLFPDGTEN